jgi:murein L,D-transpeptidase YcbB/YkuD
LLRERLQVTRSFTPAHPDRGDTFDEALEKAVRAFQAQNGLDEDGVVAEDTYAALNVPVEAVIQRIALNLERLRWLPGSLGVRHIRVNIAGYGLEVMEENQPMMAMRVIVGKPDTPTPVFSTELTEVILAPYWDIPESIARDEIRPLLRKDPGYLARNRIKRLPGGRLRQDPGPTNPLGRVKFTITNPFGVGFHNTPLRSLFEETVCAFSHGCMRIEKPIELAEYLLKGNSDWKRKRIEHVIHRSIETRIAVDDPLPFHVFYWTAWVDSDGTLQLRKDIYGHDRALEQALSRVTPLHATDGPSVGHTGGGFR